MSDNAFYAVVTLLGAALIAAVPATIAALNARATRGHMESLKETVGEKNGNGPLMQMAARALAQNMELLKGQEEMAELDRRVIGLQEYAETQIHRLNGVVGQMWRTWAVEHGVDPDVLPPPEPSPKVDE